MQSEPVRNPRASTPLPGQREYTFLETVVRSSFDGILVIDSKGIVQMFNPAAEQLFGCSAAEAIGQNVKMLMPEPHRSQPDSQVADYLTMERPKIIGIRREVVGRRLDGSTFPLEIVVTELRVDATPALVAHCRDVTANRKAEESLRELRASEAFLRMSQRVGKVGSWEWDLRLNRLRWSEGMHQIYGTTPELFDVTIDHAVQFTHPDDLPAVQANIEQIMQGGSPRPLEYRIIKPDGEISHLWGHGEVTREDGEPVLLTGTVMDITLRKQTEESLRDSQELFEAFMRHSPAIAFIKSEDDRLLYVNKAFEEQVWDGRPPDWHNRTGDELWAPEVARTYRDNDLRVLRSGQAEVVEEPVTKPHTTETWLSFKFPLVRVSGRRCLAGMALNVTARKTLEEQLRQSQKMEAFGQLAGGVAHDFNNMLTVISGCSHTLLTDLPPQSPWRDSVKAINEAGDQAGALTRQLLAFSRKTVMDPKVLDLNTLVSETEKMLRRTIGEDILLTAVLDPAIRSIKTDPNQVVQVLMNLAFNARDAMPKGGTLTIKTGNVELDRQYGEAKPGPYVMLAIHDTGCGMTPEVKSRVFEPFYSTKGVGKGTGLGLAVVHGIVKQSGGAIFVDSELEIGTTFKLYFPATTEVATGNSLEEEKVEPGTETVLLVEDEDSVRGLVLQMLQRHGYKVLAASNGKEAMRLADEHQERIDLLLTDVVMPGMDGRELATALSPRLPKMKVLFVSGYMDDTVMRHDILHEEVNFLQKPFTPRRLVSKVRQVLDGPASRGRPSYGG